MQVIALYMELHFVACFYCVFYLFLLFFVYKTSKTIFFKALQYV
jgi:hypothetical protein